MRSPFSTRCASFTELTANGLPFCFGLAQPEHPDEFVVADPYRDDSSHLGESESEVLENEDPVQRPELCRGVGSIAGLGSTDAGRRSPTSSSWRSVLTDALSELSELSDSEHGSTINGTFPNVRVKRNFEAKEAPADGSERRCLDARPNARFHVG